VLLYLKKDLLYRRKWLKRGFWLSSTYLFLTVIVKLFVTVQATNSIQKHGIAATNYIVKPTISNIVLWNINVQTPDAFYLGDYSLLDKQPIHFTKYPKHIALEDSLLQFESVQKLAEVSENWFTITPYQDSTYAFNDLRFGVMENQEGAFQFVFAYELVPNFNQIDVRPLPKTFRDGKEAFRKVWVRLKGN
jgi:inner membrane protein